MTRIVLLRLGDTGEPDVVGGHGVLSFPAVPPENDGQLIHQDTGVDADAEQPVTVADDKPLFNLRMYVRAGTKIMDGGTVWTDVPPEAATGYVRGKFYGHAVKGKFDQDTTVDVAIFRPGAYCYYLSYWEHDGTENGTGDSNNGGGRPRLATTRKFHFVVPPSLFVRGEYLPLNGISMQSVVSKWVGPEKEAWQHMFDEIERKGYNMIHFTPLQQRGESNSPYSIRDQLKFDPEVFPGGEPQVREMVQKLESKHGILAMTDVVFNHTANDSPWLRDHPEAGYNQETAPHLQAAMELDELLLHFSRYMGWHGCPTKINSTADLLKVMDGVKIHVLGQLRLWQYYVLNVKDHLKRLKDVWDKSNSSAHKEENGSDETKNDKENHNKPNGIQGNKVTRTFVPTISPDASHTELAQYIKETCAIKPFGLGARYENALDVTRLNEVLRHVMPAKQYSDYSAVDSRAHALLDEINLPLYKQYDTDNNEILENLYNRINYQRLDPDGPQLGEVTVNSPLTEPYFTRFRGTDGKDWALANNGWIWGGNPLVDFASSQSRCYLRREVIVWGDCVKLRYGSGPADSPYLWHRMIAYAQLCAKVFHGFRIDNCHSTPIHVGERLLDAARAVRPNLYVVAELFTGSEDLDIHFAERLGINSLIREAMQAYSEGELSRLVHVHGGRPIGSFRWLPLDAISYAADPAQFAQRQAEEIRMRSELPVPEMVTSAQPHALFMDCTHDNETPNDKRCVEDTLPNAALVAFCACAVGSTFGYDECYPHLLDLVNEKRHYSIGGGIGDIKHKLNALRHDLACQSVDDPEADQMHVHHDGQYITVHRLNARTGRGYFLVARTKFSEGGDQRLSPVVLSGTRCESLFAWALQADKAKDGSGDSSTKPGEFIHPVPVQLHALSPASCVWDDNSAATTITLPDDFPQGSIVVLSTELAGCDSQLDRFLCKGALDATNGMALADLQALLYRCESEERDSSGGVDGNYTVPDYGRLVYAGLQGWASALKPLVDGNELGHPIAKHLRAGSWAFDYIPRRIAKYEHALVTNSPSTQRMRAIVSFRQWLELRFDRLKQLPYFMRPRFFALVVGVAYEALRYRALVLMPAPIRRATSFVQGLALVSVQMTGATSSAPLTDRPVVVAKDGTHLPAPAISLAAGLPYFSYGFMRCWGRDVFISLRGCLLATGRFQAARDHILCFASTVHHGLVPNLLGSGREPRYNARDAAWFFLQAVQDFFHTAPRAQAESLLSTNVLRRFTPWVDDWIAWDDPHAYSQQSSIADIIYEILASHARGIHYREAHAGPRIDSQMRDPGFNVDISVDWNTGLVSGGNRFNCGTWMDKMGESERAGSKGIPGTPRDGADVEINGLLASTLRFVLELHDAGLFDHTSVKNQDGDEITFKHWRQLLLDHFEHCFYIPYDPSHDKNYEIDSRIVNRRGIYKDIYGCKEPYEDYQLRGNFPIAIVVAPELFDPIHAMGALLIADEILRGPMGLKTLDPSDLNYRPFYNNSEDSNNFATSKGRNYHQGPEWVWIYGFFLRAYRASFRRIHQLLKDKKLKLDDPRFAPLHVPTASLNRLLSDRLRGNMEEMATNDWAGLPELTNKDGQYCKDSCHSQAWSASCILDMYLDYWQENSKN